MSARSDKTVIMIAARERGPGPARYGLPPTVGFTLHDCTKRVSPAFSFGIRLQDQSLKLRKDRSPGPVYFVDPAMTRRGHDGTPAYTMGSRLKDLTNFHTPSPMAYSPEKCHPQGERHAPAFSMGARIQYRQKDTNPGPNCYTLPQLLGPKVPNARASPAYIMTGRCKTGNFAEDLAKTPGPAVYDSVHPNLVKFRAAAFSMLGRNYMPGDRTIRPGPGQYSPLSSLCFLQSPKFSMGIRHSEFIAPFVE